MIDVRSLSSLLDDEALLRKYLQRFTEDMPRLLQQMRAAYDAQEWNELSIHAHSYKSQMQYISEIASGDIAQELEIKSASSHPETLQIEQLITRLESTLKNTLGEIQLIIE